MTTVPVIMSHREKIFEIPACLIGHYNLQTRTITEQVVSQYYINNEQKINKNTVKLHLKLFIYSNGIRLEKASKFQTTSFKHCSYSWSDIIALYKYQNNEHFSALAVKDTIKNQNLLILLHFKAAENNLKLEYILTDRSPQTEHFLIDLSIKSTTGTASSANENSLIDLEAAQLNGPTATIDRQPFAVGQPIHNAIALPHEEEIQSKLKEKETTHYRLPNEYHPGRRSQHIDNTDCEIQTVVMSMHAENVQNDDNNDIHNSSDVTVQEEEMNNYSSTEVKKSRVIITYEPDKMDYSYSASGPGWIEDTKYVNYVAGCGGVVEDAGPIYMYTRQQVGEQHRRYSVCTDGSADTSEEEDEEVNFSITTTPARRYGLHNEVVEMKYTPPTILKNRMQSTSPHVVNSIPSDGGTIQYTNVVDAEAGAALY